MTQFLALAGFGFLLGMRHATDADHVIAVTTILNRSRRFAHLTLIGALWGLGHTVTVMVVGVAIIAFNVVIPPPVGLAMEFAVADHAHRARHPQPHGGLRQLTERVTPPAPMHGHPHAHLHAHDEEVLEHQHRHAHLHGHGTDAGSASRDVRLVPGCAAGRRRAVHGLAGSAAVALLVLATIQDTGAALGYLLIFCVASPPGWPCSRPSSASPSGSRALDRRRSTAG